MKRMDFDGGIVFVEIEAHHSVSLLVLHFISIMLMEHYLAGFMDPPLIAQNVNSNKT